jgi:hypothetical protein
LDNAPFFRFGMAPVSRLFQSADLSFDGGLHSGDAAGASVVGVGGAGEMRRSAVEKTSKWKATAASNGRGAVGIQGEPSGCSNSNGSQPNPPAGNSGGQK